MNITRIFSILLISIMLFSCAGKKKEDEKILPAEELYNNSMDNLENKKYKKAIEGFEELERTYPYSKWAIKAEIMSAYTNFKNEEYTDAIAILDKFIGLHPGNKDIEYAYYLKAICYYEQISDVARDQSYSISAHSALKEVIARFPASNYARDAQGKLDLVVDRLAGKEVEVGMFYLKKKKYIAAINRFKEVLNKYQTTSHVPETLHRLVEANVALGLNEEAKKYASVLGYNFPGSKWYAYSYNLIYGKNPDVLAGSNSVRKFVDIITVPYKQFKKHKNLADSVDKNVNEIGEEHTNKVLPLKVQPVGSNRIVKVGPIQDNPENKPVPKKGGILNWFKSLNVPFINSKSNQEPILEGK